MKSHKTYCEEYVAVLSGRKSENCIIIVEKFDLEYMLYINPITFHWCCPLWQYWLVGEGIGWNSFNYKKDTPNFQSKNMISSWPTATYSQSLPVIFLIIYYNTVANSVIFMYRHLTSRIFATCCISFNQRARPGKMFYFSASKSEFPSSFTKFPSSIAYFPYTVYISLFFHSKS